MKIYTCQLTASARRGQAYNQIPEYVLGHTPEILGPELDLADDELLVGNMGGWLPYTPKYSGYLCFSEKGWNNHKALFKEAYIQNVVLTHPKRLAQNRADYAKRKLDFDALYPNAANPPTWEAYEAQMDQLFASIRTQIPSQIVRTQKQIAKLQARIEAMKSLLPS